MIRDRFLPLNHEQILWEQLHNCVQGSRIVHQYIAEYQRLRARTNIFESPYYQMVRHVNGLRKEIKDMVEMYTLNTITDAISLAYKAEKHIPPQPHTNYQRTQRTYSPHFDHKFEPSNTISDTSPYTPNEPPQSTPSPQNKPTFIPLRNNPRRPQETQTSNTYAKSFLIRCYRCGVTGHKSNECQQRTIAVGLMEDSQRNCPYEDSQSEKWFEGDTTDELAIPNER